MALLSCLPWKVKYNFVFILFYSSFSLSSTAPKLDGKLDELAWSEAKIYHNFTLTPPYSGAVPSDKTTAKMLTRSEGIYIGFINQQSYEKRKRVYNRKDQTLQSDYNRVVIDFEGKGATAFEFTVDLGNGNGNGVYVNGNQFSDEWEGLWSYAVSEHEENWYSEIFIPWTIALYVATQEKEGQELGIWFSRVDQSFNQEYSFLQTHWGRNNFTRELYGLRVKNIKTSSDIKTIPKITRIYDFKKSQFTKNLGLTLLYSPSSEQLLMPTINPDFGTADADELVSNFSPIEVIFPENRTFFTENHSLFDIKDDRDRFIIINTRRIGASTDEENPRPADLAYARKYVNLGNNMDFRMLYAKEDDLEDVNGKEFFVARSKFNFDNWRVGNLISLTKRHNVQREALLGIFDLEAWTQDWIFQSILIRFHFGQNNDINKGDGTYIKSKYNYNENTNFSVDLLWLDEKLEINDLGFQERNNIKQLTLAADTSIYDFNKNVREVYLSAQIEAATNFQSERLATKYQLLTQVVDNQAFEYTLSFDFKAQGKDDLITFGKGSLTLPAQRDATFEIGTPSGKTTELTVSLSRFQEGLKAGHTMPKPH